jgi:hypothetical protein
VKVVLRTGKEIRFRFWLSEDKAGKEAKRRIEVYKMAEVISENKSIPLRSSVLLFLAVKLQISIVV